MSHLVPGHHLWASKSGHHILGLTEDYDALCKQIGQGQKLLAEMDIQIQEAPSPTSQELGTKVTQLTKLEGERLTGNSKWAGPTEGAGRLGAHMSLVRP